MDGYTDSMGSPSVNQPLSQQRAEAVKAALAAAVPGLSGTAAGHGANDPVAPNALGGKDTPAGRAENRRVTVTFNHR